MVNCTDFMMKTYDKKFMDVKSEIQHTSGIDVPGKTS